QQWCGPIDPLRGSKITDNPGDHPEARPPNGTLDARRVPPNGGIRAALARSACPASGGRTGAVRARPLPRGSRPARRHGAWRALPVFMYRRDVETVSPSMGKKISAHGAAAPGHVQGATGALALAALGIVFGDIGTSPLYTLQVCLATADKE